MTFIQSLHLNAPSVTNRRQSFNTRTVCLFSGLNGKWAWVDVAGAANLTSTGQKRASEGLSDVLWPYKEEYVTKLFIF